MASTQVAVRISNELLESLDWLVARCAYDSRGEALRTALEQLAKRERDREIDEQIRAAYEKQPITDDERIPPSFESWDRLDGDGWADEHGKHR